MKKNQNLTNKEGMKERERRGRGKEKACSQLL